MITNIARSVYGAFSFVNQPVCKPPNSIFLPKALTQAVYRMDRLFVLGNNKSHIAGGGISFHNQDAHMSGLGELVERYSSSFQFDHRLKLTFGSYEELSQSRSCFAPEDIKYFSERQYNSNRFALNRLSRDKKVHWSNCVNYLDESEMLLPHFMVNVENIKEDGRFHINTTTGTATHTDEESAVLGGFLESVERDAFCKFWYLQGEETHRKFSSEFIVNQYPQDEEIQSLFTNKKVKIITYDISEYGFCPTFVVFIFFVVDGLTHQSVGASSRLNPVDALKKACLEAYQGVAYVEQVLETVELPKHVNANSDFGFVNSFEKHFALYNKFPDLRQVVPILKDAADFESGFSMEWRTDFDHHIKKFTKDALRDKGITTLYYADLTTIDVRQLGFVVVKVVCPQLHLLTGDHNYPYLGLFDDNCKLFTELPHPFP